jgi:hypothetical protein
MTATAIPLHRRASIRAAIAALAVGLILMFCPRSAASGAATRTALRTPRLHCVLHLDSGSVRPGEAHLLVGAGFAPNETVDVKAFGAPLAHIVTDASGAFRFTLHVPALLNGGSWSVDVAAADAECAVRSTIDASGHGSTLGHLPRNRLAVAGFPVIYAVTFGAFLAACGLLFVTVGRRRRI